MIHRWQQWQGPDNQRKILIRNRKFFRSTLDGKKAVMHYCSRFSRVGIADVDVPLITPRRIGQHRERVGVIKRDDLGQSVTVPGVMGRKTPPLSILCPGGEDMTIAIAGKIDIKAAFGVRSTARSLREMKVKRIV
ncbi:hypothetical protein C5C66_07510 [Rathayibacter toxicus]|uniref:Uncharacterized protein n=1 Tax=Rathayibacter toxicus TaxID=145458 RepID=A0A0C5BAF1_9MICO|nr:hypothetical protein TI83_07665 [Rathayibacter toxicus]ALS57951.1 hypothetical protein APU90_09410 [Rathayibacter toxicus]KKM44331.1 hypothetical protein VT73_10615 [Rathayibacter toxicus]PPG20364.1 hypothetical protein C5D15_07510 [Rathayibacter toxicus]PPG45465.1 hypothetical protein C5D16_07475 [Rathayibacter toxicus]